MTPHDDSPHQTTRDRSRPHVSRWRASLHRHWRVTALLLLLVLTLSVGALVAGVIEANQQRDQHNTLIVLAANLASRVEDFRYFETVARPGARPLDVAIADATWFSEEFSRTLEQLAATDADGEWPPLLRQSFDDYTSVVHQYFVIYAIASDETTRWVESELSPRRLNLQNITADTLTYYQQADASNTFAREPVAVTVLVVSALLLLAVLIARWSVRRAEQRVAARNERRFQALVQQSSDVVVILDRNGRFDYVSPAVSGLVDYVPEELAGTDSLAFIHPEDLPRVKDALQVAVATPGVKRAETFRFKAAHGEWKWIEAIPTNLLTDPLIHGLVLNCRDVTEKIATAEEARRRDARFRSLVQHSSDVISIYDGDWLLRYASPAMERLLGLDAKELEGTHAGHLVHPDDHFRLRLNFERLKRMPDRARTFSFRAQHHHGGWRHLETIAKNRFDDPSIKGIVANARDVTERVEAATERQKVEARFRVLVEQASDVTVIVNTSGQVAWASPSVERALGTTPERMAGRALNSLLAPKDAEQLEKLLTCEVTESGSRASATMEFPAHGQETRIFEVVATNYLDEPTIQGIVLNCRDVTEREELLALLWNQANHDALTDLPTREYFLGQLQVQLEQDDRGFAVCLLDLDGFKLVNDTLGHAVGDRVLVNVAERLRRVAREGELLARFGGDEFTLLIEDVPSEAAARAVAERMVAAVATPVSLDDGRQVALGMSGGVALSRPEDDAAALLRHADMAMYMAKSLGKGRVAIYDAEMASRDRDRLDLASDLREALDHNGLYLAYQPVISLDSGRIVAFEALARWQHPVRGDIAPEEFIRLAEAFSLMERAGGWILTTACREAVRWNQIDSVRQPVGIHVNISTMQFGQPGFTSLVSAVLAETGLSPELLTLEVTESMAMERPERAAATLMDLDALGVRLAIDDFGTGYTKLASLEQLPVDLLKIDHSFVNGIHVEDGTAIVDAIISMARSLGLRVVGEGIETARELNVLLSLGCDFGQGRFFDPPLRDHEVRDRLNDQRWNRSINAAPMEPSTGSDDSGLLKGIMVNLSEDREAVG